MRVHENPIGQEIDDKIEQLVDALNALPEDDPRRPSANFRIANGFKERFEKLSDLTDLKQAIEYYRDALPSHSLTSTTSINNPAFSEAHAPTLVNLGSALRERFAVNGDASDLDQALRYLEKSLKLCSNNDEIRAMGLNNLGNVYASIFFNLDGDEERLDKAVKCNEEALKLRSKTHPSRISSLTNLASVLKIRAVKKQDGEALDRALDLYEEALELCQENDPRRSFVLVNFGSALVYDFVTTEEKDPVRLKLAKDYIEEALTLRSVGHYLRSSVLNNLASALFTRFRAEKDWDELDSAIENYQKALALRKAPHPSHHSALENLANTLITRSKRRSRPIHSDLDEGIAHLEAAVIKRPTHDPDFCLTLFRLATAKKVKFDSTSDTEELNKAIIYFRRAKIECRGLHPLLASIHNGLGNALGTRFEQQGDTKDLDGAIEHHRNALHLRPVPSPNRPISLINLGSAIRHRFAQFGNKEDLESAIEYYRESLELCSVDNLSGKARPVISGKMSSLNGLGSALKIRYEKEDQMLDLEEAINHYKSALSLCVGPSDAKFPSAVSNLGSASKLRYMKLGYAEDIKLAIECYQKSLDLRPPGHPNRVYALINLGKTYLARYDKQKPPEVENLNNAETLFVEALNGLPTNHPFRANAFEAIANVDVRRYVLLSVKDGNHKKSGDKEDLKRAFKYFSSAASHDSASFLSRFETSLLWIDLANNLKHESSVQAYKTALDLLQKLVMGAASIRAQHRALTKVPKSLVSDGASCAIKAGLPKTAIQFLEQGRSILWSKMSGYRLALDELRASGDKGKELAEEYEAVSTQIEAVTLSSENADPSSVAPPEKVAKKYFELSQQWQHVVDQIRCVEGFDNFLKPENYKSLSEAARGGPVIVINVSRFGSHGLIVRRRVDPIIVDLPEADPNAVESLAKWLATTVRRGTDDNHRSRDLAKILFGLWKIIVKPICTVLKESHKLESRIWWCPTSSVWGLPLHAAGPWKGGEDNMVDMFVSSYTPTLSSLARAYRRRDKMYTMEIGQDLNFFEDREHGRELDRNWKPPAVLAVGVPESEGFEKLETVGDELDRIEDAVPEICRLESLESSTHKSVLEHLHRHSWVHLSCHGLQDPKEPFNSSFRLSDGPLKLYHIMQARLPNPEFAFLSACHSAAGDKETPDEVIHLAAGLCFAGFSSVVGTFWAMVDGDGPDMAGVFYEFLFRRSGELDCSDAAQGLHMATQSLRRKKVTKDRWVNFVHIGV